MKNTMPSGKSGFTPLEVRRPGRLLARKRARLLTGFTLIEVIIALGLLALIAAFGLFISMDVYRSNAFHGEKNIILSVLQKARSRAMNNINQIPHGVCFESGNYVIFEGTSCSGGTNKQTFPKSSNIASTWPSEIVFFQLTGSTSCSPTCDIALSSGASNATIKVNPEGRISW